jgi:hypothetical protein
MKTNSIIELLESRIAPATLTGQLLTYTDTDGDKVAITISKGALTPTMFTFDTGSVDGDNAVRQQLQLIDVSAAAGVDGADIKMRVRKAGGGDGLAHVGRIKSILHDLGNVTLKGDLGGINCGDEDAATGPALKLLNVRSMGALGTTTQVGGSDLVSNIRGSLGALKVSGDIQDATISVTNANDATDGSIGSVIIGGSLIGRGAFDGYLFTGGDIGSLKIGRDLLGGFDEQSGEISCLGNIGPVTIGGDVIGRAGFESGRIFSAGTMGAVKIGGSVVGGAGNDGGQIRSDGTMGNVRIGRDLVGGAGAGGGHVESIGPMGDVRIGGDIIGGTGGSNGRVTCNGTIGDVRIGGNVIGGIGLFSGLVSGAGMGHVRIGGDVIGASGEGASVTDSGEILSTGRIASVTIMGSLIAGTDNSSTGVVLRSGAIIADDDIGPVKIGGSIVGNSTNPALIIARGQEESPTTGFDTAIASLSVGGDVRFAKILAGFSSFNFPGSIFLDPTNADASIGGVTVGGNWVASSLVAGAFNLGASNTVGGTGIDADNINFGDGHDVLQSGGSVALIARIASITIKGDVRGSFPAGDHFGFVAEQIDKLKIGARTFLLTAGPSSAEDNILVPFTSDVHLHEV